MSYADDITITSTHTHDSRLHVVEPPRGRSFIWQFGVNSSIQDQHQVDQGFFMESSQSYAATLTHYSTEPPTTGPDFDPLLLLLSLAGDVHPNPGPPRYPARSASRTSLANVPATCVEDARIGYIQSVLVFEMLRIIVEPMAGSVPPVGSHHSHAHLPNYLVPPTRLTCQTRRSTYLSGTPMASATNRRN